MDSTPSAAIHVAYAVATILGLLVRRTHPLVAVGVVAAGLTAQSLLFESPEATGVLLAVIVAGFSLAAYSPTRDTVTGTVLLCMAVATAIATDPSDSVSNVAPTLLLFVALPVGLGLTVRRRHLDLETLRLESLAREEQAAEAVEAERRRIARELHDVVSHAVTLVAVQSEAGQAVIERDPEAARRSLEAIGDASREALVELDRMLHVLRDPERDQVAREAGLERIPALVDGARSAGLAVEVVSEGQPSALPSETEACAFRVVQEGLTNALRHAPGSRVRIRLQHSDVGLDVAVESTGRRRASSYGGSGRGLAGLRERVVSLGRRAGDAGGGQRRLHAARQPAGSSPVIRVVVADDEALVREGLAAIVSTDPGLEVVETAADGASAVAAVRRCAPDVVLMDVRMPGMDGIEATRAIVAAGSPTRVLMLTTVEVDEVVYEALRAGASGFLLKSVPRDQLWAGIHAVAAGDSLLAPSITRRLIETHLDQQDRPRPELLTLTDRQADVVRLVAQGLSNQEIADALHLAESTVKGYVSEVLARHQLRDRTQLVVLAYESGLVRVGS